MAHNVKRYYYKNNAGKLTILHSALSLKILRDRLRRTYENRFDCPEAPRGALLQVMS